ncbi:MAG: S41 family peptidase [Chitinophagaceae bacterium]|nr:S41 family peptidase [Chitinophagaceae bacterium]
MVKKKMQVWLPLLFAVIMVAGMAIGYQLRDKTPGSSFFSFSKRTSLQELLELVKGKYVDNVPTDSINEIAANEVLSHLDPHSVYIPADRLKEVNEELAGHFQGIGIEFQLLDDTVNVTNVIKGGPSEQAGILVGDKLISVDDSIPLSGKKLGTEDIRRRLRGEAGTQVKLKMARNATPKELVITRGNIPVSSVDASYLVAPQTGYLHINRFGERTYEEFMQSMEKLKAQGMQQLILDLRGNGGGLMKEATDIADEFLGGDKLIVYTEGAHVPRFEYHCKRDGIFENGRLEVLIDETSASASEVLAGALQDWDRATLIGRRSFGKGLVQQPFRLSDGSAVRLTIARYYSPLGRNIQKPYTKGKEAYEAELATRFHNGEVVIGDTSKPMGKPYKTPGGKIVYGGGGITPDIFVPFDTTRLAPGLARLYYRNTIAAFVYKYYIRNQSWFNSFKSPADLTGKFIPGEKEWQSLVDFAAKDSVQLDKINARDKADLLKRIQVMMARQIWRSQGYFEVANRADSTVLKALASLNGVDTAVNK